MTLIKSISGIRGTIGGKAGDNLTPQDIVECTAAFGYWLRQQGHAPKVIIGRDGRSSGQMVSRLVANTLVGLGFKVVDLGLSTTPTVEMAVPALGAGAGIIITASHNPKEWNALKFLNHQGEFISKAAGEALLAILESGAIEYPGIDELGRYQKAEGWMERHVEAILSMDWIDVPSIRARRFRVVVDVVNSTGALAVPLLLNQLNCEVILLNGELNGQFAHNPEPLPEHLTELAREVTENRADLGIAVDPDVDRLALISEDGTMFGEEYTLVAAADFVLRRKPGNTVSNLSSTRALRDLTLKLGGQYYASAVGEVNVVEQMKTVGAVIGGEGNGGVILPDLHYGRDALAGIALILAHLSDTGLSLSRLRAQYPSYHMVKDKIGLSAGLDLDSLLSRLHEQYRDEDCNTIDGLKIDFPDAWVHLRKSNTEPIIRIYAEGPTTARAQALVDEIKNAVRALVR